MIVKNEGPNLSRCLDSVRGIVDEIIITDTGSQDATCEIAAKYGASIFQHPWQNDFASARNTGLERATGDWILVMDADEELEGHTGSGIRDIIAKTHADCFLLKVRSFLPQGELQKYDDVYLARLFRSRPEHRFEWSIHEDIQPSVKRNGGRIEKSDMTILHYGYMYATAQGQNLRAARNLEILESALKDSPDDPYLHFQMGITCKSLGENQRAYGYLLKVLELDYKVFGASLLARLYMKLGQLALIFDDYRNAEGYAQKSLAYNPDNVISLYVLALALLYQGKMQQAYPHLLNLAGCANTDLSLSADIDALIAVCRKGLQEGH